MSDKLSPPPLHTNLVTASEPRVTEEEVKIDQQMKRLIERLGELIGRALAEKQSELEIGLEMGFSRTLGEPKRATATPTDP